MGFASGIMFYWDCFWTLSRMCFIFFTRRNATIGVRWLMFISRV